MASTQRSTWEGEVPPLPTRAVVVAPHPDDEVLGTGGLLAYLCDLQIPVCILAVTDGERSHAASTLINPGELRSQRAQERTAALRVLGVEPDVARLGLPDGAVADHESMVSEAVGALADRSTVVIAPWRHDGHPDHESVGRAAAAACQRRGAPLWEIPIWAKVAAATSGGPPPGRSALVLSPDVRQRKRSAANCYRSQLVGMSDDIIDGPVVHPHELEAMLDDGREWVLWT